MAEKNEKQLPIKVAEIGENLRILREEQLPQFREDLVLSFQDLNKKLDDVLHSNKAIDRKASDALNIAFGAKQLITDHLANEVTVNDKLHKRIEILHNDKITRDAQWKLIQLIFGTSILSMVLTIYQLLHTLKII